MPTREQILTMPAEQLAEVSAKMMGWTLPRPGKFRPWTPHTDHNDAREVADWVVKNSVCELQSLMKHRILKALEHIATLDERPAGPWSLLFHTPEQLTRASLLAFVDNGGEI